MQERGEQEQIRINSLESIRAMGVEPYPAAAFGVTHSAQAALDRFEELEASREEVRIAGRIRARRVMGSAAFAQIQDESGSIQVYVRRDEICPGENKEAYNVLFKKLTDLGDIVGVRGYLFRTQTGEPSVHVVEFTMLSKAIRPLPVVKEKDGRVFDAFTDPEQRYRQRYVDLILNEETRRTFRQRQRIIDAMREYFNQGGYLEVETPVLQPIAGGASARPFITHHNALNIPLYLRIADELYLKRLIVGGFDGVYEFAKDFRNEGMDRTHNPEFSMVEIYVAYQDYRWMMDYTEGLLAHVVQKVHGSLEFESGGHTISFKPPFRRLTMAQALREYAGVDITKLDVEGLRAECAKHPECEIDESWGEGKLIDALFGATCEANLIQPTFITDYPIALSPLCKRHRDDPSLTERFELYVNGHELCNAYSELNDPLDQRDRFVEQMQLAQKGDEEAMVIDHDYLRAMEYGMPPCSGMGMGIDRLVMLLLDKASIQDVLLFPQMRPERRDPRDADATFAGAGVPEAWIPALRAVGIQTLAALRGKKPTALLNDLRGHAKKAKLELPSLSAEEIAGWQKEGDE